MSNKLDVFKILSDKDRNQEHDAPDFDLLNVEALMEPAPQPEPEAPQLTLPESKQESVQPKPAKSKPKQEPVEQAVSDKPEKLRLLWPVIKAVTLMLAVLLFVAFILASPKVTVNSMEPMISSGDRVVINKLVKSYEIDDVIVFKGNSGGKYVARIVASGGDMVTIGNSGELFINNNLQQEENIYTDTLITDTAVSYPVIVDEDSYFVLGDNRTDSMDSRNSEVGVVDEKDIMGKVIFCFKKIK